MKVTRILYCKSCGPVTSAVWEPGNVSCPFESWHESTLMHSAYTDAEWRADIEAKEQRERLSVIESSKDGGKA